LATVVSLHDPNLAARYCTRLVVLKDGRLFREGPTETVFERQTLEPVYGMKVVVEETAEGSHVVLPMPSGGGP
jgi:iron complex transport system ATP-binding protein